MIYSSSSSSYEYLILFFILFLAYVVDDPTTPLGTADLF
jgi:hypothetical protein